MCEIGESLCLRPRPLLEKGFLWLHSQTICPSNEAKQLILAIFIVIVYHPQNCCVVCSLNHLTSGVKFAFGVLVISECKERSVSQ